MVGMSGPAEVWTQLSYVDWMRIHGADYDKGDICRACGPESENGGTCGACGGSGNCSCPTCDDQHECGTCGGTGRVCGVCAGSGKQSKADYLAQRSRDLEAAHAGGVRQRVKAAFVVTRP